MEVIELKFLLKLLGNNDYRSTISQIKPNSQTKAGDRDKICRQLVERELVSCTEEIAKITIAPPGKALLKLKEASQTLTLPELKILTACQNENISPSQTKVTPVQMRQESIFQLISRGLIIATATNLKEVWLTDRGKEYLAIEYDPSGGGNLTLSKNMLANYLRFLRKYLSGDKNIDNPTDERILQIIVDLDRGLNTDNYLPIFYLRKKLPSSLSRNELDRALYRLQASDKISLSTLADVRAYSQEEIEAGISQPVGGSLFFITVN